MSIKTDFFNDLLPTAEVCDDPQVSQVEPTPKKELAIPKGMPLTNRLDKMTQEQAAWAIRNGEAWVDYLSKNNGELINFMSRER